MPLYRGTLCVVGADAADGGRSFGNTCYPELDQRNFHVDGIADPEHYDGTLYILKETNMRKMIQKGRDDAGGIGHPRGFPIRKSPSGRVEYLDYLTSMQKILWEEKHPGEECRLPGKKTKGKRQQSSISISAVEKARPTKSAWTTASIISSLSRSRSVS